MNVAEQALSMMSLARSRQPADRERLLLGLADLCGQASDNAQSLPPQVQELIDVIFLRLVGEAESDIRRALAEKLAEAAWAPAALINTLARDEIDIARPIIASSPVLEDRDLVRLLIQATIDHQIEVARRPSLTPPVVDTIIRQSEPAVLTALAGNDTADISADGMSALLEASRRHAALRSPLARHPRLTSEMAERLYLWVGQSLRTAIVTRFRVDPAALDRLVAEAVREASGEVGAAGDDRDEMEQTLIAKLHGAGQLRPGYLLRSLREGRLSLFKRGLATLGEFSDEEVEAAVNGGANGARPELLALACACVGLDRSVFPSLMSMVRELNGGRPHGGAEAGRRAMNAFAVHAPDLARSAFRQAVKAR